MEHLNLGIGPREQFLLDLHNYQPPSRTLQRWKVGSQIVADSSELLPYQHYLALDTIPRNVTGCPQAANNFSAFVLK